MSSQSENTVDVLGRRCPTAWQADSYVAADFTNADNLREAIERIAPDFVIHTAGRTPPASDERSHSANFWATIHLLDASVDAEAGEARFFRLRGRARAGLSRAIAGGRDLLRLPGGFSYGRSKRLASRGLSMSAAASDGLRGTEPHRSGHAIDREAFGRFADKLTDPDSDPLDSRRRP